MDTPTKPVNRVDADLKMWEKLEQHFTKRYGANVWNDRETQKVKADIFRHILNKYKGQPKNEMERMELKMLRAHQRDLNKKLYPNVWLRLGVNVVRFAGNVVKTGANLLVNLVKFIINPTGNQQGAQPAQTAPAQNQQSTSQQSNQQANSQQQSQVQGASQKNGQQQRSTQSKGAGQKQTGGQKQGGAKPQPAAKKQTQQPQKVQAKVRSLNPRQVVAASPGKGMRRS
jgi:hypothetical protein